jgi:hypothetical protein
MDVDLELGAVEGSSAAPRHVPLLHGDDVRSRYQKRLSVQTEVHGPILERFLGFFKQLSECTLDDAQD